VIDGIEAPTSFTLTCAGVGSSSALQTVRVLVRPTAEITASASTVTDGGTVTLSWRSAGGATCVASGDDSAFQGAVAASGTRTSSPIRGNWSYTLRCRNAAGEAVASTSVFTRGTLVRWAAPTQQTDGRALGVIQGFNIYYGRTPGKYQGVVHVAGAGARSGSVPLDTGTWYIAVTTIAEVTDTAGRRVTESDRSAEIRKVVP
jgi:hypothetical protein